MLTTMTPPLVPTPVVPSMLLKERRGMRLREQRMWSMLGRYLTFVRSMRRCALFIEKDELKEI